MSADFEVASVAEEVHEQSSFEMVEEALFSSLVLLGLSPDLAERKYGCSLTPDMFRASNSKGLEAVLHFLLNRVAAEAKDAFRILWPISDQKQAREFRRVVSQSLQKLERENHIPSGSFRASHLTSASGERLCIMLWHLANYAMKATLLEETNSTSILRLFPSVTTAPTIPNLETIKQMAGLRISQQTSRFVELAEQERQEERLLHDLAFSLQQEYRAQAKRKLSLAQQAKELESLAVTEARLAQSLQTGNSGIAGANADGVPNEQVQAAWTAIVQHLEDWKVKGEVLERVMDNKANCVHLDGKQLGSSSHRTESRDVDLLRLMHDWNAQLEAIYKKMTEMKNLEAKSRRRELASGGQMASHGMKERAQGKDKENMGPQGQKSNRDISGSEAALPMTRLEELAHKLAQIAQQHDQQVGVMRTVMDGVAKEEMVQMRDMIESLSKVISNSDASSKMESQLRSLLSLDGEDGSNSSLESIASRPLASATKLGSASSMTPRETPSKGKMAMTDSKATSMGLLIPPTPRGPSPVAVSQTPSTTRKIGAAQATYLETPLSQSLSSLSQVLPSPAIASQLRSFSTPSISLTGSPLRTSSVNGAIGTQGRAARGFSRVAAPDAFLATSVTQTPSTLARNRVAVASSWMNDFDEAALVQDLANAVSGASAEASPLQTHSPRAHRMSTPSSEPTSLNSSYERGRESDSSPTPFLRQLSAGASTPSSRQLNQSGSSSGKSGRKGRRSQEKKDVKKSFDTPSALFGSPFALHSQQAIVNFSPLVQAPSPVSTGTHNGQHRSSSTPRSRHSDLRGQSNSSTPLTHFYGSESGEKRDLGSGANQLLYPLGSSSVLASPASAYSSPSMNLIQSGRKRGKVVRGAETESSRSGPSTPRSSTPNASNMERRQSIIMDELAEQIIDIMGSAGLSTKNLSPSDLTKHTMAILGIKSPQISMESHNSAGKNASRAQSKVEGKFSPTIAPVAASSSSAPISRRESSSSSIEAQIPISASGVVDKKRISSSRPSLHRSQASSSSATHQRASSAASAEERSRSSKNGQSQLSTQTISNGFLLAEMNSKRKSFGLDEEAIQYGVQEDELSQHGKKSWVAQIDSALDQLDQSFSSATVYDGAMQDGLVHSDEETWQEYENDSPNASFCLDDANLDDVEEMIAKKECLDRNSSVHSKRNIQTLQDAFLPSNAFSSGTSSLDVSISLLEAQLAEIEADKIGEEAQIEDGVRSHAETEEWNDEEQDELERELARLAAEESQLSAVEDDENPENDEDEFVNDAEIQSEYSNVDDVVEDEDDELALELERLAREEAEQSQTMIEIDVDAEHENDEKVAEEFNEEEDEMRTLEEIGMDQVDATISLYGPISVTNNVENIATSDENIGDEEDLAVTLDLDGKMPENIVEDLPASSTRSSLVSISESLGHHSRLSSSSDLSNGVGKEAKSLLSTKSLFQSNKTFSLEPLLFDYPSPARHVALPCQSSPLEDSEGTDFSSTSSVLLLPTHLADSSFIEDEVDSSFHVGQPREGLILDSDCFELSPPSTAFLAAPQPSSRTGVKPNNRLNLSINPDEDDSLLPASSPGFDRIKKVLDFVS